MKLVPTLLLAFTLCLSSSCATVQSVRWAYHHDSMFGDAIEPEDSQYGYNRSIRALLGLPLILNSIAWDAATFPVQILFGVWPWWGDDSMSMNPSAELD